MPPGPVTPPDHAHDWGISHAEPGDHGSLIRNYEEGDGVFLELTVGFRFPVVMGNS